MTHPTEKIKKLAKKGYSTLTVTVVRKDGTIKKYKYYQVRVRKDNKVHFLGTTPFSKQGKEWARERYLNKKQQLA